MNDKHYNHVQESKVKKHINVDIQIVSDISIIKEALQKKTMMDMSMMDSADEDCGVRIIPNRESSIGEIDFINLAIEVFDHEDLDDRDLDGGYLERSNALGIASKTKQKILCG